MIKLIEARYQGEFQVSLRFSDGKEGVFDGRELLKRSGNPPIKKRPLLNGCVGFAWFVAFRDHPGANTRQSASRTEPVGR